MPDRSTEIETRLAHLIRAVEELSDVVAAQDRRLDQLTRRVEMLMAREAEREASDTNTIPLADQRPPHW